MKRILSILFMMLCLTFVTGCGKNHSEQIVESLQCVETAMHRNVENPEGLFKDLDACIEKYAPVWEKSAHLLENKSRDDVEHEMGFQQAKLREAAQNIIDLDLEIRDRFEKHPDLMQAYNERIARIGFR